MKVSQSTASYVCTACRQQAVRNLSRRAFSTTNSFRADGGQRASTTAPRPSTTASTAPQADTLASSNDLVGATADLLSSSEGPANASPSLPVSDAITSSSATKRSPSQTGTSFSRSARLRQTAPASPSRPYKSDILNMLEGQPDLSDNPYSRAAASRPTGPHRLYVYAHKHNMHLTLTQASRLAIDTVSSDITRASATAKDRTKEIDTLMSMSTGNIGFRKAGRGTYDAAFQLGAYFLRQMKERGMLKDLNKLEIVLRGFGPGREAMQKLLLGTEGRAIRDRVTAVMDATRLKIGGCRSPKPRRL